MAEEQIIPTFKQRTTSMILCYIVFITSYMTAQYYAVFSALDWSFILPIDKHIPFIEWMIIPYATSAPFFLLVFYWVDTREQLRVLTKRMLLVTLVAFIGFIALPIQFTLDRPPHTIRIFDVFFDFISAWDTHYNQAPSLHVAYAVIFMTVVGQTTRFSNLTKALLYLWLTLVALSTVFVYQHHSIDVLTAVIVCLFIFFFVPNKENRLYLNIKKGLVYFILASIFILIAFIWFNLFTATIILWISFNLIYIGKAYIQNNVYFIKNKEGEIAWWKYILLFPYLLTYVILRKLNRRYNPVPFAEMLPQLYIGALLSTEEAKKHLAQHKNIIVYDLSAEMTENTYVRSQATYHFFPLLDIGQANEEYLAQIVQHIITTYNARNEDTLIYIHCAMGLSRSMAVSALVYSQCAQCTKKEAQRYIQSINQNAIFKL
ncbi:MAG: phosphatase PAP2 family protein [Flavobacterium sp.]